MICWQPAITFASIRGAAWLAGGRSNGEQRTENRPEKKKNPPAEPGAERERGDWELEMHAAQEKARVGGEPTRVSSKARLGKQQRLESACAHLSRSRQ